MLPQDMKHVLMIISVAMFSWNPQRTSQKLELSDNDVICQSKDGNGFKTVLGN